MWLLIVYVGGGSGGSGRKGARGGGAARRSPVPRRRPTGESHPGVPRFCLSRGLAQEVHHAMRDSLEATAGHRKARSGVFGDDGGSGRRVSPGCARSCHTGLGLGEETGP